jgi:Ser/Thr protein kinase RdoA (MazF antagonist)
MDAGEPEIPLSGGHTPGVVRVGQTVRRPLNANSERIHRLLAHLENRGFEGAPQFLGIDARGREILSFIDGFAPPHNGFALSEEGVRAGARLVRQVHDLTEGTEFAAGSEVACHRNLSQPNFIFRDMIPVAIIDWDTVVPGIRLANFADFLWAFVHPGMYGDGEPAAHMLRVAVDAYGLPWSGGDLVDAMLATVRHFQAVVAPPDRGVMEWGAAELAHLERNADLFRARLSA